MANRYLLVVLRDSGRRHLPLPEAGVLTIGRSGANALVLPHGLVSARHAEIEIRPDGALVTDVGSRNGTFVNGERIDAPRPISPGDRVVIGNTTLQLMVEETARAAVTLRDDPDDSQQVHASIDTGASMIVDEPVRREAFRALAKANKNLAVLNEMGGALLDAKDEHDIGGRVLDLVFDILGADRACVILKRADGSLDASLARTRGQAEGEFPVSATILNRTLTEGLGLLTSDAGSDERLRTGNSVILQGIRAAMCVPIRGKSAVLGAIYADTRLKTGVFTPEDLELLTTLGIQGGITIENLRLIRENVQAERLAAVGSVVAGLGHDIRNILSALGGGAYMMNSIVDESNQPDLSEAWAIMRSSMDTIKELVNDMVSYSKEREPERRPTDLGHIVTTVADRFSARAAEAGADLAAEVDPNLGTLEVEGPSIDRVLSNLVGNALDSLPVPGGEVRIRARPENGNVLIEVSDSGVGIPPEDRERIFDLLYSTKGSKGTGFGLAVSRKIVREHGGTIEVDSEPGRGTTFRIALPRG